MSIAARMIAIEGLVAIRAMKDMSPQGRRAALADSLERPLVAGKQAWGIVTAVNLAIAVKDLGQF
jgi:hypothetical protein